MPRRGIKQRVCSVVWEFLLDASRILFQFCSVVGSMILLFHSQCCCVVFFRRRQLFCVCVCCAHSNMSWNAKNISNVCSVFITMSFCRSGYFCTNKGWEQQRQRKKRKTKRSTFTVVGDVDLSLCVFDFLLHVLHNSMTDDALKWQGLWMLP